MGHEVASADRIEISVLRRCGVLFATSSDYQEECCRKEEEVGDTGFHG